MSSDIFRTFWEMSRTNPMHSMAPIKAAAIISADPMISPCASAPTIASETISREPDEMPRINGLAIGLAKKVCSRKPETDSAPPSKTAARMRGRRMSQMTAAFSPLRNSRMCSTSLTDNRRLPEWMFQTSRASSSIASMPKDKI